LSAHPEIYMPAQKELAFFSDDKAYSRGVQEYLKRHFSEANGKVAGEASPHYMCFDKCASRIHEHFPDVKLVAVLRNPIDRAYSHYRMALRRKREDRTFEEAITALIDRGPVEDHHRDTDKDFVLFGEYGRIIDG